MVKCFASWLVVKENSKIVYELIIMDMKKSEVSPSPTAKRKIIIGGIVLILGQISPLILIPVVVAMDLSSGWTTALSGMLMFGIPELAILASVAIMGKQGFEFLKGKAFGYFKKIAPPDTVSSTRYRIGLFLFFFPILIGWLLPYFIDLVPFLSEYMFLINILGDVIIIVSLFVLGGDFWDKIRSLFIQKNKIDFK